MDRMHQYGEDTEALSRAIVAYARNRIASPQPLDRSATGEDLTRRAGGTITPDGLGGEEALRIWSEVLAPATISTDHPSSMAFVPGAPTKASVLFDLVVGSSSTIAAGWIDGAGAIWAENQALRWVADLAGYPPEAGGVFVSGGSAGNLSALVAARKAAHDRLGRRPSGGWKVALAESAHSSIVTATRVMDVDVLRLPGDDRGTTHGRRRSPRRWTPSMRPSARACSRWWRAPAPRTPAPWTTSPGSPTSAVIAASGCTSTVPTAAPGWSRRACGLATTGSNAPTRSSSTRTSGCSRPTTAAPCSTAIPNERRGVFRQEASYLETVNQEGAAWNEWNPADFAYHLTRRARGLPFWFSLATYGTDAYREAVEAVLALTRETAAEIERHPDLELLMDPELSVVLFRRTGLDRRRLRSVVAPSAGLPDRVRPADVMAGREGRAPVLREPAHHDRPRARRARHHGLTSELAERSVLRRGRVRQRRASLEFLRDRVEPCDPLGGGRVRREQRAESTVGRAALPCGFTMNMCASAGLTDRSGGTCLDATSSLRKRTRERIGILRQVGAGFIGLVLTRT